MNRILLRLATGLVVFAIISTVLMLARNSKIEARLGPWHPAISAVPLLAVGSSFLVVQLLVRPRRAQLLKNLLLAATFLLWGAVQLVPQNLISQRLGDVVIALYVTDLAWTILVEVKPMARPDK